MDVVTKVKICGITNLEDAQLAVEHGAWAIGLIFADSPRQVDVAEAERIGRQLNRQVEVTGVFVNAPLDQIAELADVAHLSLIQMHGDEGPAYCREVARRTGARIIKAMPARNPATVRQLRAWHTNYHLLDAYDPGMRGGTGKTFHWEYARHRDRSVPLILSGGLEPDNVAAAIDAVGPFAVDTASGTEASPGRKDPAKVAAFFRAVAQADGVDQAAEAVDGGPELEAEPEVEAEHEHAANGVGEDAA